MAEQLKNIWNNVIEFWGKLSSKKRKIILGGLIVLVIGAVIITFLLNHKEYTVLFRNMDEAETSEVMQLLQKSNVDYKYQSGGNILIPKKQENVIHEQA